MARELGTDMGLGTDLAFDLAMSHVYEPDGRGAVVVSPPLGLEATHHVYVFRGGELRRTGLL